MIYTARATYKGRQFMATSNGQINYVLFSEGIGEPLCASKWTTTGPRCPRIVRSAALRRAIPNRVLGRLEARLRRQGAAAHLMHCKWRQGPSLHFIDSRVYETAQAIREQASPGDRFVMLVGSDVNLNRIELGPGEVVRLPPFVFEDFVDEIPPEVAHTETPSETVVPMPDRVLVVGDSAQLEARVFASLFPDSQGVTTPADAGPLPWWSTEQPPADLGPLQDIDELREPRGVTIPISDSAYPAHARIVPTPAEAQAFWSDADPLQDINELANEPQVVTIPILAFVSATNFANDADRMVRDVIERESASVLADNWQGIVAGDEAAYARVVAVVGDTAAGVALAYLRSLYPEQGEPLNEPLAPPATFQQQRARILDDPSDFEAEHDPSEVGEYGWLNDPLEGIEFLKGLQTRLDDE